MSEVKGAVGIDVKVGKLPDQEGALVVLVIDGASPEPLQLYLPIEEAHDIGVKMVVAAADARWVGQMEVDQLEGQVENPTEKLIVT